jgi:hypothetical protein
MTGSFFASLATVRFARVRSSSIESSRRARLWNCHLSDELGSCAQNSSRVFLP